MTRNRPSRDHGKERQQRKASKDAKRETARRERNERVAKFTGRPRPK